MRARWKGVLTVAVEDVSTKMLAIGSKTRVWTAEMQQRLLVACRGGRACHRRRRRRVRRVSAALARGQGILTWCFREVLFSATSRAVSMFHLQGRGWLYLLFVAEGEKVSVCKSRRVKGSASAPRTDFTASSNANGMLKPARLPCTVFEGLA